MPANIVKKDDGKLINLGPSKIRVKEDGSLTRSSLSILETEVSPKTQLPPQHIHRTFEEIFYILEGEIEFVVDTDVVTALPGDLVTIPIGVPHTYRNATDQTSRLLIMHTDARMVQFFEGTESLIKIGVPAPQAIAQLLPQYDTDIVQAIPSK